MSSVLDINRKHSVTSQAFLDPNGGVSVQRYDMLKYRQFDKLTESQLGFFWRPDEIDLTKDGSDFKVLSEAEEFGVTYTLSRQILLDSVQGRAPNLAFLPIVSLPEIEAWITTWAFSETIHSRSYTHILRNVFPDPSKVFDSMMDIQDLVDCAGDISKCYDDLIDNVNAFNLLGEGIHEVNSWKKVIHLDENGQPLIDPDTGKLKITRVPSGKRVIDVDLYTIKKLLWLCIMSVNILEGVRFYASFAFTFAMAENKKLEGNAKIIKLICRDENLHLAATQTLLKLLPKDDPDFAKIAEECQDQAVELFRQAAEQEKQWCDFLFSKGSIMGLNSAILKSYVEWIANKRMTAVGLPSPYKGGANPLPWTLKWISGADVQVAPQEVELSSYQIGATKQDVTEDTFKHFEL